MTEIWTEISILQAEKESRMAGGLGTRPKLFCGSCATKKIRALEEISFSPLILLPCSNRELNFIYSSVSMSYGGLGGYSNWLS